MHVVMSVGRLREELRVKNLHKKGSKSLDELEDALCHGKYELANAREGLRSLSDFPYLKLGKKKQHGIKSL
jgi:hypothetical protein